MEHEQKPPNNQTNQKPRTETVICNIIPANPFNAYCWYQTKFQAFTHLKLLIPIIPFN